jgi:hypothetical protein
MTCTKGQLDENNDIVIDAQVIRLYDAPSDPKYKDLFTWIAKGCGKLAVSQKLLVEYYRTQNHLVGVLINQLIAEGRLHKVGAMPLKQFKHDKHYGYTCNQEDIHHARLVFTSNRKKLVTHDQALCNDVNGFKKIDGVKPMAVKQPTQDFYR